MEPAQLSKQFQRLQVVPGVVGPAQSQALYILASNFHSARLYPSKGILVTHDTRPLLLIPNLHQLTQKRQPATAEFLSSDVTLTALVYYKPAKDQKAQMEGHIVLKSKDLQRLSNDWQSEVIIPKWYSKYCSQHLRILTRLSLMWRAFWPSQHDQSQKWCAI